VSKVIEPPPRKSIKKEGTVAKVEAPQYQNLLGSISCRATSGIPGDEAVVKLEVLQFRESQQGVPHSRIEHQPHNIQSLEVSVKIECRAKSPINSALYYIKEPDVPDL
jgi:hypothetical protein